MAGVTVEVERYRWPERIVNAGASVLYGLGLRVTSLDPDDLLATARSRTGLHDWGDDHFVHVLRELVRLLEGANITPLARMFSRGILIKAVVNRLKLREHVRRVEAVTRVKVERPLFVVGFPRTGTTTLQNLLALHPDRRALQFWELTAPVPEHADAEEDARRRVASTNRMLAMAYRLAPEMAQVHEIRATTPEEDWALFANTFAVLNYEFQSGLTAFGDLLMGQDLRWAYAEFREMLQLLLHQRPAGQLVLKCPEHLWFLDSLLAEFPDACVVWTHRDPVESIASYCSLISMNRRVYYGRFRPADIGPHITERFLLGIERAMAVRQTADSARFLDVRFEDLVSDHAGTVRRVEEHFDLPRWDGMEAGIAAWLASDRLDERGKHLYDADRYGLDTAVIRQRYGAYIERFAIPVKA